MDLQLNANFKDDVRATELANMKRDRYITAVHARRRKIIRLVTGIILMICLVTMGYRVVQYQIIKQQIAEITITEKKTKAESKGLKQQVTALNDPTYLQQLIREKYMYTKQGEQVYNLPNNDPDANK